MTRKKAKEILGVIRSYYIGQASVTKNGYPKETIAGYSFVDVSNACLRGSKALEQEPKTGHWIEKEGWDGDVYYECSVCEEPFCLIDGTPTDNMYNFCPNCGAKMESEDMV